MFSSPLDPSSRSHSLLSSLFIFPTPPPPSSVYSLSASAVVDVGHMPQRHSLFFVQSALSSVTAINQPLRHGDGALGECRRAQCEYARALRALLANRATLTSPHT